MGFHLSKKNREIVESIIPKLKDANNDIKITTADPRSFEYILRNAGNTEDYSWIKDKFTLRIKEGYLLCKLKNPSFTISDTKENITKDVESGNEKEDRKVINKGTMLDIFNDLFNNRPLELI